MPETSQTYLLRVWCDDNDHVDNPYDMSLVTISPAYARKLLQYRAGWMALQDYGCTPDRLYSITVYDYTPDLFGIWEDWDDESQDQPNRGLFYDLDGTELDLEDCLDGEVTAIQPVELPDDVGSPKDYSRVQIDRHGVSWKCRAKRWTGTLTTAEIPWDIIATLAESED